MAQNSGQAVSRSGKYTTLIILVIVFILMFLGILLLNFYIADKLARETQVIDIASRQSTISQRLTRAITEFELLALEQHVRTQETLDQSVDFQFQDQEDALNPDNIDTRGIVEAGPGSLDDGEFLSQEQIELDDFYFNRMEELRGELRDYSDIFNWTLEGFIRGGSTRDIIEVGTERRIDDKAIELSPVPEGRAQEIVGEAEVIWRRFYNNINVLMNRRVDDFINITEEDNKLREASVYARANNVRLLNLMNELARVLTEQTATQASNLRFVQFGGIALALGFFLIIMYYILLRFRSADAKLDQAKQETDEIMANVGGGLFLLGTDLTIASQHSAELTRIFNNKELGGQRFDRLLKELLPSETLETAVDYVELLLGDRVNQKLVEGLNPIDEVEVNFPDNKGGFATKYLEFKFSRALRDSKIQHLLVTVNDITKRVLLEKELEESYEHREEQLELLLNILHINPQELLIFIDEAELSLNKINDILRESNTSTDDNRNKVSKIFRLAHSLKGDASALELESFERMTHNFEDELDAIKKMRTPSGNDFIPLVVKLEDMLSHLNAIKEIALRLSDLRSAVSDSLTQKGEVDTYAEEDALKDNWAFVEQLGTKVAGEEGKDIELSVMGLSDKIIPPPYQKLVRDAVIQLTRNAIVHGIETPAQRSNNGKPGKGLIQILFRHKDDDTYELLFRDDGQGIDKEHLKSVAVQRGLLSEEKAMMLGPNQAYSLIFHPGFSTAKHTNENAGRGVGMDVVRNKVKEAGGKLRFKTNLGQNTEFRIILPNIGTQDSTSG